ncbi:hypothetical protein BS78_09G247100 [Paspalum vaginatum]|nr:hypothetical protein BS78_09G247100 [Paspalum vaginatum]
MDAAGEEGDGVTYHHVEQRFNIPSEPSAQERLDRIVPFLVSLLPAPYVPDAGRTAALSTSWRRVCAGTPLLVDDAHLLHGGGTSDVPVVRALSRCVGAHPGPVGGVRVTRVAFYAHEYALRRLVADLADKGVRDLVLFNRPWPLDMPLPDDILRCASLHRLYLGVWHCLKTSAERPPAFPELRELGLFHCIVRNEELEALLAHCPKLEILSLIMSYHEPLRLRLASDSLKIAVDWMSSFDEVVAEHAPKLERLLFQSLGKRRPVRIVCAPRLEVLGFLDLDIHTLEIVSATNMVPILKTLAVKVQFACNREAKLLSTLLKCFPRLKTLHVMPAPANSPDSEQDSRFWEHRGPCECIQSHLETVIIYGSTTETHGIWFIHYIMWEGKALKTMGFVCSDEKASGFRHSMPGGSGEVVLCVVAPRWSFQAAIDLSLDDPLSAVRAQA